MEKIMKFLGILFLAGVLNVSFAFAQENSADHHDAASEKAEHALCEKHDEHCKVDEAGMEKTEHQYCEGHKEHCKAHGKKKIKK